MNLFKFWDKINDIVGNSLLHPQYFAINSERKITKITLSQIEGKVLDIGSGRQLIKKAIENKGCQYTSLDHPLIYSRQRSDVKPDIFADICSIPLPKESVDSVLLFMVLEHIPNPLKGLEEIQRITKKGGLIYISTVENYPAHDLPDDYFRYRIPGIISLCKTANLKIKKSYSWGNSWQVNAVNFNLLLINTAKIFWDKYKNIPITLLIVAAFYPLILISNVFAFIVSPFDITKSSRMVNFVIAQK